MDFLVRVGLLGPVCSCERVKALWRNVFVCLHALLTPSLLTRGFPLLPFSSSSRYQHKRADYSLRNPTQYRKFQKEFPVMLGKTAFASATFYFLLLLNLLSCFFPEPVPLLANVDDALFSLLLSSSSIPFKYCFRPDSANFWRW